MERGTEVYKSRIANLFHGKESSAPSEINEIYTEWAGQYENEILGTGYKAHKLCAAYFEKHASKLNLEYDCRILDVGCGSGLAGIELQQLGYTNIDGTDVCQAMLDETSKKGVYTDLICCATGNGHVMPFDDGSHDGVTLSGALQNIKEDGVKDLIRLLKSGGLLVSVSRLNLMSTEMAWFHGLMMQLIKDGAVEELEVAVPEDKFYMGDDAVVHVYKRL